MYHFIVKSLKTSIWILLPLLFISGTKGSQDSYRSNYSEGRYELQVSGALEQQLCGVVYFENTLETNNQGIPFATLSLMFIENESLDQHSMELLISKQNQSNPIKKGKYGVAEKIEGLLNDFDGVFGFANLGSIGEEPFFAKQGKVVITKITELGLKGYLDITLNCNKGTRIFINGSFSATRERG
ncbi:MAG: hypothetical protein WBM77_07005 [Maribacter sp.]